MSTDSCSEGLGVVYERAVLNAYLFRLLDRYPIREVLEAPLYGMAGVTGINSVPLAQRGCQITLMDTDPQTLKATDAIWKELKLPCHLLQMENQARLPFESRSFDLAWNWAALWYLKTPQALLRELARVSRQAVFIAMPNRWQVGYWLRRHFIDRDFFNRVDESWTNIKRIRGILEKEGVRIVDEGVLDVPPWPDTVMPAAEFLRRMGIRSRRLQDRFSGKSWNWSSMEYYRGNSPGLMDGMRKYTFLERAPLPWRLKLVWAHHHYLLGMVP